MSTEILFEEEREENENSGGGKHRGQNKMTKQMKEDLFRALEEEIRGIDRLMRACTFDERAKLLHKFLSILCSGYNDEISNKVRAILWDKLEEHYKKLHFYIPHLSPKDKVVLLRQLIGFLAPEHRNQAIEIISKMKNKS